MSMTEDEFRKEVPAPPADTEPAPESDDENPNEDFWKSFSSDEDEDEPREEAPVAAPPVEESAAPKPPTPTAPEPAPEPTPEVAVSPPPAPVPEPEAPAPQMSEEQVRQATERWQNDLTRHYTSLMEDESFAEELLSEPKKVLPKLMSATTQVALQNSFQMINEIVPRIAQRMAMDVISSELGKRAFFRKYPQLRSHEQGVERFLSAYRDLPQNRGRSFEDVSNEAAVAYMARNRIPMSQVTPERVAPSSPPPPPPVGVAPSAPPAQDNFWGNFANELLEEDI